MSYTPRTISPPPWYIEQVIKILHLEPLYPKFISGIIMFYDEKMLFIGESL